LPLPFCSIRIQYSGPPGSAVGEVTSLESKGDLVIDSRLANERDGWAGSGGHPWHLDEETESVMFLTNMGDKPARIGFDVVAEGRHYYLTKLQLQPHETQAVDLRKLRDAQKADFKGNKIPAAASDGSVIWSRLDHVPVMGRLLILQRHKGLSSNYDCHICDCPPDYADLALDPVSMSLFVNNTMWNEAFGMYQEHCNQYYWWGYVEGAYTSNEPVIATATVDGLVKGRSGGATSIRSSYTDYWYTYSSTLQDCVEHNRTFLRAAQTKVKPHIDSISPTRGLIGVSTSVTIRGSGFGADPTVSAGTGIAVTRGPFSDTEIQATFAVAGNAPSGNHSVKVTTSQGDSNADKTFYVQVPTSLQVLTVSVLPDGPDPPSGCPASANYGIRIDIKYLVRDQGNPPNPIQSTSMTPHETGTFFSGGSYDMDIGPTPGYPTSTKNTASDGTFHDVPVGVCRNLPISNPGLTSTQNITVITPTSSSYPVRSQSFTVTAPGAESFGHGAITNGSDISASR
jgi:hypothetical protein